MKILILGGTGTISTAVTKLLINKKEEVFLLNRGNNKTPKEAKNLICDIHNEEALKEKIKDLSFDVVADFISFTKEDVERNFRIFNGKTKQFIFISSASAYQKPCNNTIITENTPLDNPFWEYSRNKQLCEEFLIEQYQKNNFPVTIVRPSHTYGEYNIPVGIHGKNGSYAVIKRMLEGKKIIVHGDGESLWVLTHNSDFAKAFVGLLGNQKSIGETFHITSDEALTWNQIYRIIANKLGVSYKPFYISSSTLAKLGKQYDLEGGLLGDKANSVVFDNSKIKSFVKSFNADVKFKEGVSKAIDNVLNDKSLQKEDEDFNIWSDNLIAKVEQL